MEHLKTCRLLCFLSIVLSFAFGRADLPVLIVLAWMVMGLIEVFIRIEMYLINLQLRDERRRLIEEQPGPKPRP